MGEYLVKYVGDGFVSEPDGIKGGLRGCWDGTREGYVVTVDGDGGGTSTPTTPEPRPLRVELHCNGGFYFGENGEQISIKTYQVMPGQTLRSIGVEWFDSPGINGQYVFRGFFLGDIEFTVDTVVTDTVFVVARWEPYYKIAFHPDGGFFVDGRTSFEVFVYPGATLDPSSWGSTQLPEVVRDGYTFQGWFDGYNEVTVNTEIRKDMCVTARWSAIAIPPPAPIILPSCLETRRMPDGKLWTIRNLDIEFSTSGWAYMNSKLSDRAFFGLLYQWQTALDLVATLDGYHIPTDAEWTALAIACGGTGTYGESGTTAGRALKATRMWATNSSTEGLDTYLFTGLPGGSKAAGTWSGLLQYAYFWTSTRPAGSNPITRVLCYSTATVGRDTGRSPTDCYHSVRLIKDE